MTMRRKTGKLGNPAMKIGGISVANATKPLAVRVTTADIKGASRKDPMGCAAAIAAMRQIPQCRLAKVHASRVYLLMEDDTGWKQWVRYATPNALRTEITSFDRGGTMQPDDYTLPLPPSRELEYAGRRTGSDAPGARDRGSKDRTPSYTRPRHVFANVRVPARGLRQRPRSGA